MVRTILICFLSIMLFYLRKSWQRLCIEENKENPFLIVSKCFYPQFTISFKYMQCIFCSLGTILLTLTDGQLKEVEEVCVVQKKNSSNGFMIRWCIQRFSSCWQIAEWKRRTWKNHCIHLKNKQMQEYFRRCCWFIC